MLHSSFLVSVEKKVKIEDPDALIDQKKIEAADKEWDKAQSLFQPSKLMHYLLLQELQVDKRSAKILFRML